MQDILKEIIDRVPQGHFFDSHFVIEVLAAEHPAVYKREVPDVENIHTYHGQLALKIKKLVGAQVVEQQEGMSWSRNIKNNYSECALWKKL